MSVYTVSLRDTSNLGQVNIGDGTLLANLSVAAGRGPKGDGWTGVTYDESTGTFIFTSNDGLAYTSPDVRPEVDLDNVDINSGTIDGTVIGGTNPAAASFTQVDLKAIAESKAVTAVDVFVYDTSKDSDGGAWRKRTQATSWYNETLNTATRGNRREFPSVAVIVAEDDTVTIYDGDDPSLPMWMVFTSSNPSLVQPNVTATTAFDGILCVSTAGRGLSRIEFNSDDGVLCFNDGFYQARTNGMNGIAERNTSFSWTQENGATRLINNTVNDVAMTVLPDAPIDPATGLQVPTIAVATNGGVSVITDAGDVFDITHSNVNFVSGVGFRDDGAFVYGVDGAATRMRFVHVDHQLPTADVSKGGTYVGTDSDEFYPQSSDTWTNTSLRLLPDDSLGVKPLLSKDAVSSNLGLNVLAPNPTAPTNGMVAFATSTYNTGWMNGDIKGAFLSSTDPTSLVDTELVTNGTFATDISGWTAGRSATLTLSTNALKVEYNGVGNPYAYQGITTVIGTAYTLSFEVVGLTAGENFRVIAAVDHADNTPSTALLTAAGNYSLNFTATAITTYVKLQALVDAAGEFVTFDNVSVRLADEDRSVNSNGLTINGTITRTPVATGADLVGYSGFSASNYLEQPYNSDLDFGTGDFSVMGWMRADIAGSADFPISWTSSNTSPSSNPRWGVQHSTGTNINFNFNGSTTLDLGVTAPQNIWQHVCFVRQSNILYGYIDGMLKGSVANTTDVSGVDGNLKVGVWGTLTNQYVGSAALLRISATAPSAEQIAKIYNDEKVLFQENAQATLYGTSDAVTALAHDSDTDLLHAGTSAGRSVFQGLRRVENTTDAVGAAISASNGLVVEE